METANSCGCYKLIEEFEPAVILFHGCASNEVVTAAKYAADHPAVLLYVDSHEDFSNSARFCVKYILHRLFYGIGSKHLAKNPKSLMRKS